MTQKIAEVLEETRILLDGCIASFAKTTWRVVDPPPGKESGWIFFSGTCPDKFSVSVAGHPLTQRYRGVVVVGHTVINLPAEDARKFFKAAQDYGAVT